MSLNYILKKISTFNYNLFNFVKFSIYFRVDKIDYKKVFQDIFYGVNYTDYLFSLPMGAGKTFLMACFIYLDLYFAINEPENKNFAHNFTLSCLLGFVVFCSCHFKIKQTACQLFER